MTPSLTNCGEVRSGVTSPALPRVSSFGSALTPSPSRAWRRGGRRVRRRPRRGRRRAWPSASTTASGSSVRRRISSIRPTITSSTSASAASPAGVGESVATRRSSPADLAREQAALAERLDRRAHRRLAERQPLGDPRGALVAVGDRRQHPVVRQVQVTGRPFERPRHPRHRPHRLHLAFVRSVEPSPTKVAKWFARRTTLATEPRTNRAAAYVERADGRQCLGTPRRHAKGA